MSTLKHKQFIQSRKRKVKLVASEKEKNGLLMMGVGEDDSMRATETPSNGDDVLSPTQECYLQCKSPISKQPVSVRFSNTLDLIVSPYLPDQSDAETLDRFHNDIWYTREDYRNFYRDRLDTVRLWRSLRTMEPHQQQHHYKKLELRGLEQYQSGSVSAEHNQQRAQYMETVLRAAWERRQLLEQNDGNPDTAAACESMIRDRAEPHSQLASERAQYLAAQDTREAWSASGDNHNNNRIDEEDEANNLRCPMEEGEQSPMKKPKRCVSPPESPQSILDLQLLDGFSLINNHSIRSSNNNNSIVDDQQPNERDRRLRNMKQYLVQDLVDAPPTPVMRCRGTFNHNQRPPDMRMTMTDMVSAPSTPMNGRRTVASLPEAWNNMMGAPTPMHRRSTVCPFSADDGMRSNLLSAASSAPLTPIMNGNHVNNGAAPLTPTISRANRMMKYPPTPYTLTSRGTNAGLTSEKSDRYMISAQQLLDQHYHDIRRRSSEGNNNMLMTQQQSTSAMSHHGVLHHQESLTTGMHHSHHGHHHHHQQQQQQQHNAHHLDDEQRRHDTSSHYMHQHASFSQQQQIQHNDMRRRAESMSSALSPSGSGSGVGAMHQQYEAMRRGSLSGLDDGLSKLCFHNSTHSTIRRPHERRSVQPSMTLVAPQDQSERLNGMPLVGDFASMRRDSLAGNAMLR